MYAERAGYDKLKLDFPLEFRHFEVARDPCGCALRALFANLHGAGWRSKRGWPPVFGTELPRMHGVTLSASYVVSLDLSTNYLNG